MVKFAVNSLAATIYSQPVFGREFLDNPRAQLANSTRDAGTTPSFDKIPCRIPFRLGKETRRQRLRIDNNLYTQIGVILLIALSAKNAILIVEVARECRHEGKPLLDAAVDAAIARLRPILMTSFAFILGVAPRVVASGAGASARKSIGITVFSGMLASTCLAVLFVPSLFVVVQRLEKRRAARKAARVETAGQAN